MFRMNYGGTPFLCKQLLYPSTFSILYWWEINKLSCRYKYFTQATIWFAVLRRRKHRTPCSVILRERYLEQPSVWAYLIKMRPICPLSNLNSNAQEFHLDVPLINFNWFDAWYNTNIIKILRLFWNPPAFDVENKLKSAQIVTKYCKMTG